jgi:hypothetical protein
MSKVMAICCSQYAIFLVISVGFYYSRITNGMPESEAAKKFVIAMIALTCVTVINAIILMSMEHFFKGK